MATPDIVTQDVTYGRRVLAPRPIRLYDESIAQPEAVTVGIVPFVAEQAPSQINKHVKKTQLRFLTMRPSPDPAAPHIETSQFQIIKGTRRNRQGRDLSPDDLLTDSVLNFETKIRTAYREGKEEAGLKPGNVTRLFDMGCFVVRSSRKDKEKVVHLFAAQMREPGNFGPYDDTTAETRWITRDKLQELVRSDHAAALDQVASQLEKVVGIQQYTSRG